MDAIPSPSTPPLRVGVLLDSLVQPAWIDAALAEIRQSNHLELALVVLDGARQDTADLMHKNASAFGKLARWVMNWRQVPYWLYLKMEARLPVGDGDPFQLVDLSDRLAGVPVVRVQTLRKKFSDWFPDAAVDAICHHELDVAQRFGFRILKGRALSIARHGVWSFHHGDYRSYRGGPAGFWEVVDGNRQTGMLLQRLTEDLDDGVPIASVLTRTDLRSGTWNRRQLYPLGPKLLARELVRLHRRGPLPAVHGWSCYSAPLFVDPQPNSVVQLAARTIQRRVTDGLRALTQATEAGLAITWRAEPGEVPHGALYRSRVAPAVRGLQRFDPCCFQDGDKRSIILCEAGSEGPAHLALLHVGQRALGPAALPIYAETAGDLRSPAPFRWGDTSYIYAVLSSAPGLRLLRCRAWPDYWELADIHLPELPAHAVSLREIDGRWWLFAGVAAGAGNRANCLYMFHAASPLGPWTPHPLNPVHLGDDGSCPAGPPFRHAGHWYRPARDHTQETGCCLTMMRLDDLTPENFIETPAAVLRPDARLGFSSLTCVSAMEGATVYGIAQRRWLRPWQRRRREVSF